MSEHTYFTIDSHISYMYDFRETELAISFLDPQQKQQQQLGNKVMQEAMKT